jgi:anti-sigma factor RsiW
MNIRTRTGLSEPHPHMGPLISSYQDGLANPAETAQVERHLLECERCRAFYANLQEVREAIADLPVNSNLQPAEYEYSNILNRTIYRNRPKKRL